MSVCALGWVVPEQHLHVVLGDPDVLWDSITIHSHRDALALRFREVEVTLQPGVILELIADTRRRSVKVADDVAKIRLVAQVTRDLLDELRDRLVVTAR